MVIMNDVYECHTATPTQLSDDWYICYMTTYSCMDYTVQYNYKYMWRTYA